MSKVTLKVEIEEEAYKAFIEQEIISCGIGLLSEVCHALKNATPLTESDDAVSREAVCEITNGLRDYLVSIYNPNDENNISMIHKISNYVISLYALPSVLPERERGEWKQRPSSFRRYECSKCHNFNDFNSKYCPHCGAKMR